MKSRMLLIRKLALTLAMTAAGALVLVTPSTATAGVIDCTSPCTNVTFGGGILFSSRVAGGSTGTGLINSFVRINGGSDGDHSTPNYADGHNTDSGTLLNEELAGTWTHALQLKDIPTVLRSGVLYYEFLLDVNEPGSSSKSLISLNNVQLCTAATGNLTAVDACPGTLETSAGTYGSGADAITMDASDFSGSGSGDMFMYVRVSDIGTNVGAAGLTYLYLFSQFGRPDPEDAGGFEEWAVRVCGQDYGSANPLACVTPDVVVDPRAAVPEPGSVLLLGGGLAALIAVRRRRSNAAQA